MMLGLNSEASPFDPALILDDLSEIVKVDPYPTGIPASKTAFSADSSRI